MSLYDDPIYWMTLSITTTLATSCQKTVLPFALEVLGEEYLEVEEYLSELFEVALVVVAKAQQQQQPQVSHYDLKNEKKYNFNPKIISFFQSKNCILHTFKLFFSAKMDFVPFLK